MRTVYVDVLLAVNLVVDYFLLLLDTKFLRLTVPRLRLLLGALVGAAGSLVILLPPLPPGLDLLVKLALSGGMVLVSFGFGGWGALARRVLSFFILSFSFAGIFLAVWYLFAPRGLFVKNSVVYFDVPPLLLICLALGGYLLMRLFHRLFGRGPVQDTVCRAEVTFAGRTRACTARVDTGCALREPFSGLPVVVAQAAALPAPPQGPPRMVPFTSVGGDGLLRAWRPDRLRLCFPDGEVVTQACYVAFREGGFPGGSYQALVPPELLQDKQPFSRKHI